MRKIPEGPILVKSSRKIPAGEAVSRYEAPRGEDLHYVRSNGTEKPDRVKVRAPTLANIQSVSKMLEDRYLADMPIVIAAIDPCFSCTDRLIAIYPNGVIPRADKELRGYAPVGKGKNVIVWETVRLKGIEWYKNKGIDFTSLNKKLTKLFEHA
jgi:membrane-bound hydrogenase subunit alpha